VESEDPGELIIPRPRVRFSPPAPSNPLINIKLLISNENWMKNAKQKTSNGKCSEEMEDQMTPVEINDEVAELGQTELYVVVSLDGSFAKLVKRTSTPAFSTPLH
jgi:hypothetical protein